MMMMIPEPWENHESMDEKKRAFYEFHSCLMEPWDGPASIAFTDGTVVGAVLDRNGLRPSRYYVTKDDLVIMASEVGVLDVPPERVLKSAGCNRAACFWSIPSEGRIISDEEIKQEMASAQPYAQWLNENHVHFDDLPTVERKNRLSRSRATLQRQQAFGYNFEDLRINHRPDGAERHSAGGLDGHRYAAGGVVGQAAVALQLFQAALRPGHQSADRSDPRRVDHLDDTDHWLGRQSARTRSRRAAGSCS